MFIPVREELNSQKVCFWDSIFNPSRHFIGTADQREKKELLMECSHFGDLVALPQRKAGDR